MDTESHEEVDEYKAEGEVEEYVKEFEEVRYATIVHNPVMDETFYVT
jgi:hypothetical protein